MDTHRETKLQEIRELIELGEYHVEPQAVAEALMQRLSGRDLAHEYGQLIARTAVVRRRALITPTTLVTAEAIRTRALAA